MNEVTYIQLIDRVVRQKLIASWFWQQLESAPIHILTLTQCSYVLLSFINRWNIEARTSHLVLETVGCGYRLCRFWCEFDMQGMYARWASRPLFSYRKQQPVNLLSQSLHFYTKPKLMFSVAFNKSCNSLQYQSSLYQLPAFSNKKA